MAVTAAWVVWVTLVGTAGDPADGAVMAATEVDLAADSGVEWVDSVVDTAVHGAGTVTSSVVDGEVVMGHMVVVSTALDIL